MVSPINILQIVSFTDMLAVGLIMPQMPPHAARLGFNHIQIGLMISLYSAFQVISGPIIGSQSDIKGRKPILVLCLSVCAICYAYLGITGSILIFFTLRSILGTFKQTQLLTKALTPDYENDPKKQSVLYGRLMSLSGLGMSIGPVISGHIMEEYPSNGFTIISATVALIFATNTGIIYSLPDVKKREEEKKTKKVAETPPIYGCITNNIKQSLNEFKNVEWSIYWDVFLFKLIIALSIGLYFGSFALFLRMKHEVSAMHLGYITSFQGAIGTFSMYFIGHINKFYTNDKDYTQRIFHLFITATICFLAMATVPNVAMFVAVLIPKAIGNGFGRTITIEMITSRSKDSQRGTVLGAANSVKSLSGVITPVIGGVVMQYFGVMYVFYVAAFITSIGIIISYRMRSKSVKVKSS